MLEFLFFGEISTTAFLFEIVVFRPRAYVAVGDVFARGRRDGFVWAIGFRIRHSEVLIIRLAMQIVHVNTFATFVDV